MALVRERYADFGPTLACEKLYECHGIRLGKETAHTAAMCSSTDGPDRCAAATMAACSSTGNATVSICIPYSSTPLSNIKS